MPLSTETEIQAAYQDETCAEHYISNRFLAPLMHLLHGKQVAAVQRIMDKSRPQHSLEIAPGPGRITRDLRPVGRLSCLEFNEAMLRKGQAACGDRATFIQGNAFQLPFSEEFDLVYSFRFVRHFHDSDRARLYAQILRVLRPGGLFVMDAVNERISRPERERSPGDYPIYDKLYSPDELRAELAGAGLELLRLEPVQKCYHWQHRSQTLLGPRADWANRLVIGALERLPFRDGLEWIVTCRRA